MEEKSVSREESLRTTFHKLNNYLFIISGKVEILLGQEELPDKVRDELNIISSYIDEIKKLVEETSRTVRQNSKTQKI